jgi:hypothetical protein
MARVDRAYLERRTKESLVNELAWEIERIFALREAFKELPEVPPVEAQSLLHEFSTWPRDWERGKKMQRQHGIEAVPPNTECECGAGLWALLREALTKST